MADRDETPTAEQLVEALADVGEVDAGVDVLDALRMRDPARSRVRLQARLFMAEPASAEAARAALSSWCGGALDDLVRAGALIEAAVGFRVLARLFPDEPAWGERHARVDSALAPLPNAQGDPQRARYDQLMAQGAVSEAYTALRALARNEPHDADLARRVEVLSALTIDSLETRPYGALTPEQANKVIGPMVDVAMLAARVQRAVREGDLRGALVDAVTLSEHAGANQRWARFRNALQRLVAWSNALPVPAGDDEVTQRTGPLERADLWLRAGNLTLARDAIRAQFSEPTDPTIASALATRLADLDVVLDGTLPTPIPARPPAAANVQVSLPQAPSVPQPVESPPFALPVVTPAGDPQGNEDTAPARPLVPAPETPPRPPSQPPVAGDVRVSKRKIVRLS
jgi:hypothetical protein